MRLSLAYLSLIGALLTLAGCRALQEEAVSLPPTITATVAVVTPSSTPLPQPTATDTASPSPVPPTPQPTATDTASPTPTPTPQPTATSTTSPSPVPPTQQPTAATRSDADDAVQVVLDYWEAVNARDYSRAYRYWANDGAASGQSEERFARGFSDTVQVTVLMGAFVAQGSTTGRVTLPVTLLAVANVPGTSDQRLQHYQGTYTLQAGAGAWHIATASIRELPAGTPAPAYVQDPLALLYAWFEAINHQEYARAYTCWSDPRQALGQSYAQFHRGFATTRRVAIQMGEPQTEGAAGSSYTKVPILIVATQTDGTTRTYCGSYTLRRANVPPFDQFGWRIEGADIAPIASVRLNSPEAERLLSQGCRS